MKKYLLASLLLLLPLKAKADPAILYDFGAVKLNVPFTQVDVVALWDIRNKQGLAGGQTPIATLVPAKIGLVAGAVTSTDGQGTPYVGLEWAGVPNPASMWFAIENLHPGIFAGRNFHTNEYIYGLKASVSIF